MEQQTRRKLRLTVPSQNQQNVPVGSIREGGQLGESNIRIAQNNLPGFVVPGFVVKERRETDPRVSLQSPTVEAPARRQRITIQPSQPSWGQRLSGALGRLVERLPNPVPRRKVIIRVGRGWEEHGWKKDEAWQGNDEKFVGEYRTDNRSWQGYALSPATRNSRGDFDFYIYRPPDGVSGHSCWHHAGEGWYWVNYTTPPPDLLSGIKHIENFLAEVT